jgi:hypothetical protein
LYIQRKQTLQELQKPSPSSKEHTPQNPKLQLIFPDSSHLHNNHKLALR